MSQQRHHTGVGASVVRGRLCVRSYRDRLTQQCSEVLEDLLAGRQDGVLCSWSLRRVAPGRDREPEQQLL